jgi:uncharacterized protein YbjT (DUF2867 family)
MAANQTTILIVGGTGLIGARTVQLLLAQGHRVRALVREPTRAQALAASGAELFIGDLADPATLAPAFDGVGSALLVSSLVPEQVALQGNFVEAARRAGQPHIVKVSGFLTAADSAARSGRWHAQTEQAIVDAGLPWTFLRPPFFMQNLFHTKPHVIASGELSIPVQHGAIAMIDAHDVASAAASCLIDPKHAEMAYTLTGPEALTMPQLAQRLGDHTGHPVRFVTRSIAQTRAALESAGTPAWRIGLVQEFYEGFERGAGAEVNDLVQQLTGTAAHTIEAFLDAEDTRAFWQS